MIQLNLLPDVKLEYTRAQHQRRVVITVSFLVSVTAVLLLVLLLVVSGLQKKHLSDLTNDINKESSQLQQKPDINKILTVQNQLNSLTALHAGKPAAQRLFDYLNEVTPARVNITTFKTDFTAQTATISGTADALSSVNKFVDTLKYTKYTVSGSDTSLASFSDVVMTNFGINSDAQSANEAATYTLDLKYDKAIFDATQNVKLVVPNLVTTRAALDNPTDLFQPGPSGNQQGGQ